MRSLCDTRTSFGLALALLPEPSLAVARVIAGMLGMGFVASPNLSHHRAHAIGLSASESVNGFATVAALAWDTGVAAYEVYRCPK